MAYIGKHAFKAKVPWLYVDVLIKKPQPVGNIYKHLYMVANKWADLEYPIDLKAYQGQQNNRLSWTLLVDENRWPIVAYYDPKTKCYTTSYDHRIGASLEDS
jgi:hypothetical protein